MCWRPWWRRPQQILLQCLLFMWRRRTFFTVLHQGKKRVSGILPDGSNRVWSTGNKRFDQNEETPEEKKNKDTLRTTQFLQRGTRVILPVLNVRTSGIMPIIVLKGSKELKEQAPSPRSPKTYRKLCVFIARKQDIMLLNVPTRRKLELSSWNFDMDNKSGRNQFFFSWLQ